MKIRDAATFRRTALGACMIAGPLVALAGGLVTPWEKSETTDAYLTALAGSPERAQISAVLLYFGYLLIAVSVFGMVHLIRHRAGLLGNVAGVLAAWGWVTLPGLLSVDFYHLSLAQHTDRAAAVVVMDRAEGYLGAAVLGLPVLLGFLGLVLLTVALWRSGTAPAWVPAAVLAGLAVTFVAPVGALSWAASFGAISAALGYVGLTVLRMSDEAWERGPTPEVASSALARPQAR